MGVDRPPLPAPTDFSSSNDQDTTLRDDLATEISTRTDKTSYSIPEDGSPVTINTAKSSLHKKHPSQTSLLIEYFEGGKGDGKVHSRPSVRVRVTPSSRKNKTANDHLQITRESRTTRKPSYTRRISLGSKPRDEVVHTTDASYSEGSNVSSIPPPVEIEVLQNSSDISSNGGRYIPAASDISSMPADSMLEGTPVILSPGRRRSRSLERKDEVVETVTQDTLKAPTRQPSRSLSKERITQRVMEKLGQKPVESSSSKTKETTEIKTTRDDAAPSRKSHRRISKSSREEEMSGISGTESSLLSSNFHRRSGDTHSLRSGASGTSSINNPKLLATVEDAIKRLILPELNALKEEQRTQQNRSKFERMSGDSTFETVTTSSSREHSRRRVSKSSSAPHMHGNKPKVVLNRDENDPGTILSGGSSHKGRRSSRGSVSDRSYAESTHVEEKEKVRRKKSKDKDKHSARDAALIGLAGAGLTAAALRHHDSRESKEDRKERRRRHSRSSRSRTASVSESIEEEHLREEVPPLPILQSELIGSELTRESILSAETETRERPGSRSSRGTGTETPIQEVARGFASPSPRTPTRTPVALQRGLGTAHSNKSHTEIGLATPKSDRSFSSRSRDTSSAALEAAAAAKARAIERRQPQVSQYEIDDPTSERGLSPIQSEASYREREETRHEVTRGSSHVRSVDSGASISSAGRKAHRPGSSLSIQSFESSASTKAARTRKRPQGMSLEKGREILGEPATPGDVDEFFEQNHEQNEMYRRELEGSEIGSPGVDYRHMTQYTDDSQVTEPQYLDHEEPLAQDIRKVGSNPEYVHTPIAVESAVASLHEPSNISVRSSVSSPLKRSIPAPISPVQEHYDHSREASIHQHPSQERWEAIRGQAQTLASRSRSQTTNSPRQSTARSIHETPQMQASAFPSGDMPEIGYGMDDESEVTTNPSIIKGPLGAEEYHDQTDQLLSRHEEREQTPTSFHNKAAVLGAVGGAAAIAAAAAARVKDHSPASHEYHANVEDAYDDQDYEGEHQYVPQPNYARDRTPSRSPALWKDEGYQSANQRGVTPEYRSKLLDDEGLGDYDDELGGDVFTGGNTKHMRHVSGNSHGMSSPLYDSATGKGIDRIQSKDVVALMDHLTVRDAQRNARDTEILVTLVRSAAEMRNSFEEMKQFIRTQDAMIMNNTDKRVDLAEQRIIGGPRPQPLGSPRVPRSSSEDIDIETKKKSVFKRALRGLSMKGDNDIKKIEQMLVTLLDEVEGLKHVHTLGLQQQNASNSMTSYEQLRASGDPGYEPEGRAGTASSPNQSGYLSNPSSRRIQDMYTNMDVHQPHRISTVEEDDEEFADHGQHYENTERMTTPTQEARRQNMVPQDTPPQASRAFRDSQSQENTPKKKHKSNSSSIFGIPKISRWSKTTASTNPESLPRNSGSEEKRPYSTASRSGSQVNVAYYGDDQYDIQEDDRLRSNSSLAREEQRSLRSVRSPSPLIPEEEPQYILDDPKYQAHRNSLNLQHPQPRPGPTGRHQNHLETQAQIYEPIGSPEFDPDQWGSNPSLARNRLSGGNASQGAGNLSPINSIGSDGAYSQHSAAEQAAAPPRPPKIQEDGPLVPNQQQPLAGHGQTRQMYSSPNEFGSQGALTPLAPIQEVRYSLETDTGHRYSPTPSPRPNQNLQPSAAAMASPIRKITGPRPMGSRSPSGQHGLSSQPQFDQTGTVRRKPVSGREPDIESLDSYHSSLDSEIF
ncbi:hypothetical protein BDV96DRAFT_596107 [Lophiotrema nucula]|uniref:Uncharacterized protein n=1 Tax=Lophiotrema nucula TaxID=690887 RepID=A0A6A5ZKJ9_9PLEO|nr:hypothetical protein BDV96DRAFT_596107 [Lophiotrema nucula]